MCCCYVWLKEHTYSILFYLFACVAIMLPQRYSQPWRLAEILQHWCTYGTAESSVTAGQRCWCDTDRNNIAEQCCWWKFFEAVLASPHPWQYPDCIPIVGSVKPLVPNDKRFNYTKVWCTFMIIDLQATSCVSSAHTYCNGNWLYDIFYGYFTYFIYTPCDHYFLTCSGTNQVALESKLMQKKCSECIRLYSNIFLS
jgi:hypothetical protein